MVSPNMLWQNHKNVTFNFKRSKLKHTTQSVAEETVFSDLLGDLPGFKACCV